MNENPFPEEALKRRRDELNTARQRAGFFGCWFDARVCAHMDVGDVQRRI